MRTAAGSILIAVLSGLIWAWCFGPTPYVVVPWVALVPLIWILGRSRASWLALVCGMVFWWVSIGWIIPTMVTFGQLSPPVATAGMVLLAVYLGSFWAVFGWLGARIWRGGGTLTLLGLPALWVVLELARGWLLTGFPWNLAAYSWIDVPGALPLSAWIGPWGVSFVVVLVNVAAAGALFEGRWKTLAGMVPGVALLLAVAAATAPGGMDSVPGEGLKSAREVRVVQPEIYNLVEWDEVRVLENYRGLFALSEEACDDREALVFWPESAAWPYSYSAHAGFRRDIDGFSRERCALVLNTPIKAAEGHFNSAILARDGGIAARYDKRHLVPFGEYVPMAGLLPFLDKLARNAGDFEVGTEVTLLPWRGERIGTSICFEVTFPGEVSEQVRAGATVLSTMTNDAWYGETSAPWQHYRAARFRAAENRRYLVRAAITGVSGLFGPAGQELGRLGVGQRGVLSGQIEGRSELSPYSSAPWLVPAICWLLTGFAIFRTLGGGRP